MMIVSSKRKCRPVNRVKFGTIRHGNGKSCRAWHAFAGDVQVGGCCKSKAEAERELRGFLASERMALKDL